MKAYILLIGLGAVLTAGCGEKEKPVQEPPVVKETPKVEERVMIEIGDHYDQVILKLGKPNLESKTQHSLVMIYDQIEVKLENLVVVEVFDHRGN